MIGWLLRGPMRALLALTDKIREETDKEIFNVQYIQQQLILLYTQYEMQEVGQEEFEKQEAELLSRLEAAKELEWEQILSSDDTENE